MTEETESGAPGKQAERRRKGPRVLLLTAVILSASTCCILALWSHWVRSRPIDWDEIRFNEAIERLESAASGPIDIAATRGRAVETTLGGTRYIILMRFSIPHEDVFRIADAFSLKNTGTGPWDPMSIYPWTPKIGSIPLWFTEWENCKWQAEGEDCDIVVSGVIRRNFNLCFMGIRSRPSESLTIFLRYEMSVSLLEHGMPAATGGFTHFYTSVDAQKDDE